MLALRFAAGLAWPPLMGRAVRAGGNAVRGRLACQAGDVFEGQEAGRA